MNEPASFVSVFDPLSRAVMVLDAVEHDRLPTSPQQHSVDFANHTRRISGAFYNIAGLLYQAAQYANAVPFLLKSCQLGVKALRLPRPVKETPNESRDKEWSLLEEQLFRRWEILGACYWKNGDRKNAYVSFKQSIYTFPFQSSGLISQSDHLSPESLFSTSASPSVKKLISLIDRVSYIGACRLSLPADQISLLSQHPSHESDPIVLEPSITGALLERQLVSLEPSQWQESVRAVSIKIIHDILSVYSKEGVGAGSLGASSMPVRGARVLVRLLELLYWEHTDTLCTSLGFGSVGDIAEKIETLLGSDVRTLPLCFPMIIFLIVCLPRQVLGKDAHLARYASQYRISVHLWMVLHVHRRAESADACQIAIISQHSDNACKLLGELLSQEAQEGTIDRTIPPGQNRAARRRVISKEAPAKTGPTLNLFTPKPRRSGKFCPLDALYDPC